MYCVRCGKKLPGDFNKCRKCPETARENAWYCPHCGNGVKKTAKECDVCKEKLDLSPANYIKPAAKSTKSRKIAVLLSFLLGFSGLHFKYLGFDEKFSKRVTWSGVSVLVSIVCLIAFRAGINSAFTGGYDAQKLEEMTAYIIILGCLIIVGALSLLVAWGVGIADGVKIIRDKDYRDGDGEPLR